MGVNNILQKKCTSAIIVLAGFFVLFLGLVNASQLSISIGTPGNIYQWCIQPYIVEMDTNGISTKSVDAKLLLTWYFSINFPYTTMSDAVLTATWYAKYMPWRFDVTTIQTGIATSWANQNREYLYINAYQLWWFSSVTGDNIPLATLYLKANTFATWYLNFYSIMWWNSDDSNISSGINEGIIAGSYTQYVDSLDSVTNLTASFIAGTTNCTSRPYISSAQYRQTWYISTPTGVQAVWTSVVAWPLYSWTSNRTIWTKWNVALVLTGISDSYAGSWWLTANNLSTWIQLTYVQALNHPYMYNATISTWWFTQYYGIGISGNITTWFVWFDNVIWNTGSTYLSWWQKYTDTFNIDVFWIDTVTPTQPWYFTWYIGTTGVGLTHYLLSGINFSGWVSNPTNGFHSVWTDMDDQYKVISFSGTNSITQDCIDRGYVCTNTWYMSYLNTTGYVRSGNNIFKLLHDIYVTTSFSGYVTVIDRAGNTGQWYMEVNMDDLIVVNYWLLAYPQAWVIRNEVFLPQQLSGMLIKLAIYSGWFDKTHLLNNLLYTGFVKTSNTGWAGFTGNFASGQYQVLAEWSNTLTYLLTWVQLSSLWGMIDYTQTYTWWFKFGDTYSIVTTLLSKHASYLSDWNNRDGVINVADLAHLVSIWTEFGTIDSNPSIWVYSGNYFVDIPSNGTWYKIIPYSLLQSTWYSSEYMQYHPYDLNANGLVDVADYMLANWNYNTTGATYWWLLDWLTTATMPF